MYSTMSSKLTQASAGAAFKFADYMQGVETQRAINAAEKTLNAKLSKSVNIARQSLGFTLGSLREDADRFLQSKVDKLAQVSAADAGCLRALRIAEEMHAIQLKQMVSDVDYHGKQAMNRLVSDVKADTAFAMDTLERDVNVAMSSATQRMSPEIRMFFKGALMGYSTRMTQMTSDIRRYSVQSLDRLSRGLESTVLSTLCKLERDVNDAAKHMATLTEAAIGRVESGAGTAAGALGDIKDAHEVHAMRLKQLLLNTERQCTFALEHSGITISMAICRDDVTAAQREVGAMKQSFVKRLPVSSSTTLAPSSVAATGKVVAGASSPADAAKTANALATTLPSPSLASNTIPLPPAINVLATPPPSPSSASNTQTTLAVAAKASSPVPSAAQKAKKKKKASAAYPYSVLSKETTDFIKSFKNYLKTHHLSAHTHGPLRDSTITNRINHARRIIAKHQVAVYTAAECDRLYQLYLKDPNVTNMLNDVKSFLKWKTEKEEGASDPDTSNDAASTLLSLASMGGRPRKACKTCQLKKAKCTYKSPESPCDRCHYYNEPCSSGASE